MRPKLTPAELRVMKYVRKGYRDADIALELGRSVRTIEQHMYRVRQKLRVRNRVQAIRKVWR